MIKPIHLSSTPANAGAEGRGTTFAAMDARFRGHDGTSARVLNVRLAPLARASRVKYFTRGLQRPRLTLSDARVVSFGLYDRRYSRG
jgi:hypothetical protein